MRLCSNFYILYRLKSDCPSKSPWEGFGDNLLFMSTFITWLISRMDQHICLHRTNATVLFHWLNVSHSCGNPCTRRGVQFSHRCARTHSLTKDTAYIQIWLLSACLQPVSFSGPLSFSPQDVSKRVFLLRKQRESFSFGLRDLTCGLGHM